MAVVFACTCLEAYINEEIETYLKTALPNEPKQARTKQIQDLRDRLMDKRLADKWMDLPILIGTGRTFEKGKAPFQDFSKLVTFRNNRLVHSKVSDEIRDESRKDFLPDLLLDLSTGRWALSCCEQMISHLCELTGRQVTSLEKVQHPSYQTRRTTVFKNPVSAICTFCQKNPQGPSLIRIADRREPDNLSVICEACYEELFGPDALHAIKVSEEEDDDDEF